LKNMMFSIIIPSTILSASSLSVFSLDPDSQKGDRFGVLFTVVLTIVANQFVTQDRLPYLAYFTWLDASLLGLQLFVYAVIVETAIIDSVASSAGVPVAEADMVALWVLLALFGTLFGLGVGSGLYLFYIRSQKIKAAERLGAGAFEREELRLRKLWFPEEFRDEETRVSIMDVKT
jgi:hypothetical protein